MQSTASSLPSRSFFQRFRVLEGAVSAGHNPLWIFIPVSLLIAYLVLPPLFFIVYSSFIPPMEAESQALTLSNYTEIFSSLSDFKLLIWNSLVFSIGSSAWALLFGTTLAWLAERSNAPFRAVAYVSAFVSFAVPGLIKVIGWILLLGPEAGFLNVLVGSVTGIFPLFNVFSMTGMVLIEGFLWTPVVFLLMAAPFRSMDPSLEEAAVVAGSSDWQVFKNVTVRMAMPSVLSVLTLTFIRSLEAFEIPAIIGIHAGIEVFTTQIYLALQEGMIPEYGFASAYSIMLIAVVALALIPYYRVTQHAHRFTTITGKGFNPRRKDLGSLRWLGGALLLLLPAIQLLPLTALFWASLTPYLRAPSMAALRDLSFQNYVTAFHNDQILGSIRNSLIISTTSATAVVVLTFFAAWIVTRTNLKLRWSLDRLVMLPLVFPGIVMGVAILKMYLSVPVPIYGTIWIMVAAFSARYLPYGMRFCHAGMLGIHKELEESATASGATWMQAARNVIVPLMLPALFAGWIYIFLITIRELSIAILLYSPGSEVISVVIWELWDNGAVGTLSAYALGITAGTVLLASLFHKVTRRYSLTV
ncbi:MAG TPA: iron ABC transporter permease [Terriglobales bacterium]|nr:iron ABC transporter permease [Terriglobales bacterium]